MIQKMINSIKYSIRKLAIKFYDKTEYYVVPKDLFSKISLNHNKPEERILLRADAIIERMRIIGR